jgi:hypothetical protein
LLQHHLFPFPNSSLHQDEMKLDLPMLRIIFSPCPHRGYYAIQVAEEHVPRYRT